MHITLLALLLAATLPAPVQHALDTQFPQARVTRVEKASGGRLEVTLEDASGALELTFDSKGEVQVEDRVMKEADVPAAVLQRARRAERRWHAAQAQRRDGVT